MDASRRAELRAKLTARFAWLADPDVGPSTVEAGECDGCGVEPRMVTTCGPGAAINLGRRCALAAGGAAWCDGHQEEAAAALAFLACLPDLADTVARMWWVATGEVALPPDAIATGLDQLALSPAAGGGRA
jgi:hypothetical protein